MPHGPLTADPGLGELAWSTPDPLMLLDRGAVLAVNPVLEQPSAGNRSNGSGPASWR